MAKKFIVFTTGRSGSTALMGYLEGFSDIGLPNKNIRCPDNELMHPRRIGEIANQYQTLCNVPITSQDELIEQFFRYNEDFAYAGFKSMPLRHSSLQELTARRDIKFIVLTRNDLYSTVASFFVAIHSGSWHRSGEPQQVKWRFSAEHEKQVFGHLRYIHESHKALKDIKNPVRISYEDLCRRDFQQPELDDYFGRSVKIANPQKPVSAMDYVLNWEVFAQFIDENYRKLGALD